MKPTAKIKMWQWIYRFEGDIFLSKYFFATAREANEAAGIDNAFTRRADWTEIEVEQDE
jgi:hypothetical protein